MRQKTIGLTKKQKKVLDYIKRFHAKYKYPPSVRQICSALELSSPATVHVHINHLVDKKYIKRSKEGNRAIKLLVPNEYEEKDIINIPLLGESITRSIEDEFETPNTYLPLPTCLANNKKDIFAFKVYDNNMSNIGIYNGDIVIAEKTNYAKNGEFVIILTDKFEILLRTYYKENNYYKLQAECENSETIILDKVNIIGKVIGSYHKF